MKSIKRIISIAVSFALILTVISVGMLSYALDGVSYVSLVQQPHYGTCQLVAHRGLSSVAPENTLASFELAAKKDFYAIELDIYPTTDGRWVIMHDGTVDRMTNKTGKITNMTYAQTQECTIDAGNNIEKYKGLKIPTLEQALDICEKNNVRPFIEIKGASDTDIENLSKLLLNYKNYASFMYISFDEHIITKLKSFLPDITIMWLISKPTENNIAYCAENHIDGIDFNYTGTSKDMVGKMINAGLMTGAWTVDNVDDFINLSNMNIDFVTTNSIIGQSNTCTHICHSTNPIFRFFWKIIKIFIPQDELCSCYAKH